MGRFEPDPDISDTGERIKMPTRSIKPKKASPKEQPDTTKIESTESKSPTPVKVTDKPQTNPTLKEKTIENQNTASRAGGSKKENKKPKQKPITFDEGIILHPKKLTNSLFQFSDLPVDYAGELEFEHYTARISLEDKQFLQELSKKSGKPAWVVLRSLIQTYTALMDKA